MKVSPYSNWRIGLDFVVVQYRFPSHSVFHSVDSVVCLVGPMHHTHYWHLAEECLFNEFVCIFQSICVWIVCWVSPFAVSFDGIAGLCTNKCFSHYYFVFVCSPGRCVVEIVVLWRLGLLGLAVVGVSYTGCNMLQWLTIAVYYTALELFGGLYVSRFPSLIILIACNGFVRQV